jgi:hypothetical protein
MLTGAFCREVLAVIDAPDLRAALLGYLDEALIGIEHVA